MIPRCEVAPLALAQYLLSSVPFVLLIPVDLLSIAYRPRLYPEAPHALIEERFQKAGKVTILETQMLTWVFGNMRNCAPVETFANSLRTPAPVTGYTVDGHIDSPLDDSDAVDKVEGTLPRTLAAWARAQERDPAFASMLDAIEDMTCRQQLWIHAPSEANQRIIVPLACQELLVRDVHVKMFHLNHQKVSAIVERPYFWPTLRKDARKFLEDCPECELQKARQNTAHGLFHSLPIHAPRTRWCMDFQGQDEAETGKKETLALIDPTCGRFGTKRSQSFNMVAALPGRNRVSFWPALSSTLGFCPGILSRSRGIAS
jgi:hypothetical protein